MDDVLFHNHHMRVLQHNQGIASEYPIQTLDEISKVLDVALCVRRGELVAVRRYKAKPRHPDEKTFP